MGLQEWGTSIHGGYTTQYVTIREVEIPFLNKQYKGVAEDFEHCSYGFGTWKSRRTPESFDGEPSFACKNMGSWWVNPEILNFNPHGGLP